MPKISIIIPTYNRANVIGRTIESFISQTYKEWELLVVDDHSTDNTAAVIETFMAKDARIKYYLNERSKGAQGARNTGILKSSSEWILLFDSDDYAYPNFLEELVSEVNSGADVISSLIRVVHQNPTRYEYPNWGAMSGKIEEALYKNTTYVTFNMAMIRRSKLMEMNLLDEDCMAYQELDTHLRLSSICNYKSVNKVLSDYYFCNADSITSDSQRNNTGRTYILSKHSKRWRKLAYKSFFNNARHLFFSVNFHWKKRILAVAPEIIPVIILMKLKYSFTKIL